MQNAKLYVITGLFLLTGPIFAVSGTADLVHHRSLAKDGTSVRAEVVDTDTRYARRAGTTYEVTVRYDSDRGTQTKTMQVSEETYVQALTEGGLDVRYDPADPAYVKAADASPSVWLPLMGLGMAGIGFVSARRIAAARKSDGA